MDKNELKKLPDEKGIHWLITALVEGSIGYHTPEHAKVLIGRSLNIHQNPAPKSASAVSFPQVGREVWEKGGVIAPWSNRKIIESLAQ